MKKARLEDPGISFRSCASDSENCEMKLVKPKLRASSVSGVKAKAGSTLTRCLDLIKLSEKIFGCYSILTL